MVWVIVRVIPLLFSLLLLFYCINSVIFVLHGQFLELFVLLVGHVATCYWLESAEVVVKV